MKAIISVVGDQAAGYEVTLSLPREWTAKFRSTNACFVGTESLYASWGNCLDETPWATASWTYKTLAAADARVAQLRKEIDVARAFLASVVKTDKAIEIEL